MPRRYTVATSNTDATTSRTSSTMACCVGMTGTVSHQVEDGGDTIDLQRNGRPAADLCHPRFDQHADRMGPGRYDQRQRRDFSERPVRARAQDAPKLLPAVDDRHREGVLRDQAAPAVAGETERHRARIARQLAGAERLEGSYPFDLLRSVKAYRLNTFLHELIQPASRGRILADEEAAFDSAQLSSQEHDLVRRRDWRGLIHYGVIFFMLEKLGALYSVAGKGSTTSGWDAAGTKAS